MECHNVTHQLYYTLNVVRKLFYFNYFAFYIPKDKAINISLGKQVTLQKYTILIKSKDKDKDKDKAI